jgi:hypothetical protein
VAGLGVRIYTDEHIFRDLAKALRDRGYDAESCQEAGLAGKGISDEGHLEHTARAGRAILTHDRSDFLRLDTEWKRTGRQHAGIIVAQPIADFGELLRRVERHLNTYPQEVQHDTLLWLDPRFTQGPSDRLSRG